eukprot:scaffold248383_cov32-Tisochrysis_lutea.AAC.1
MTEVLDLARFEEQSRGAGWAESAAKKSEGRPASKKTVCIAAKSSRHSSLLADGAVSQLDEDRRVL